jgi:hypothetical protein
MPAVLWSGLGSGAVGAVADAATEQAGAEGVGVVTDPEFAAWLAARWVDEPVPDVEPELIVLLAIAVLIATVILTLVASVRP